MDSAERKRKIESYGQACKTLMAGLKRFPKAMWQFRPAPDRWTIHEILIHLADSEANSYVRCRRLIAESGTSVMAYDERQWAKALDYHRCSVEDALELFKWLRGNSYQLIRTLPDSVWGNTVYHPEAGRMTLDDWLDVYDRHIPDHLAQMQQNYEAWLAQK